ncbi:MAG: FAD-binding protein [Paracoccaceae bacterium]
MQITDEAGLSEVIRSANAPLRIQGGGTRGLGRASEGALVDMSSFSGITLHEPGALTLVAKAGTPVSEIEDVLAKEGQRLAFEPYFLNAGTSTIGGVMATNASGPRRIQAGAARDFLLGVRFVDGSGDIVKNGGRVMKNVTGYDLVKLMGGSWGTLGVLTEVSLKVLPVPETEGCLILHGLSAEQAVKVMSSALGSPFEVSGAAHLPENQQTWLRVEGFDVQVKHRLTQLTERLKSFGEITTDISADWTTIRDAETLGTDGDLWRISVKPSDAPRVAQAFPEGSKWFMDWGGGLIWASVPAGQSARPALAQLGGHATLMRAAPETHKALGTFQPELPGVAALTAGLRAKFDPRGIFNAQVEPAHVAG